VVVKVSQGIPHRPQDNAQAVVVVLMAVAVQQELLVLAVVEALDGITAAVVLALAVLVLLLFRI
jgi:hypothetical protein